jgi:hypothetical protein
MPLRKKGKEMMGALVLVLVGAMLSLVPVSGVAEEPALSGEVLLKHCESALQNSTPPSFEAGVCVGMLQTLTYIQPLLDPKYEKAGYCLPQRVAEQQEIQVVVTYLQAHPERLQEEGQTLALDAFHQAFPCQK